MAAHSPSYFKQKNTCKHVVCCVLLFSVIGIVALMFNHKAIAAVSFFVIGVITAFGGYKQAQQRKLSAAQELPPEKLLQMVIDSIPQRICWKDTDFTYLGCNKAFAKDAGVQRPEDIIGKTDYDLWNTQLADAIREHDAQVMNMDKGQFHVTEKHQTKRGERSFEKNFAPVHDSANNKVVGLLTTYSDITDQENYQQKLQEAMHMAEDNARNKADFLANMSHEIRTPMNGVLGMLSLALQSELTEEQRNYLETAHNSGDMLLTLLNDILDISKIEAGKMQLEEIDFSVRELVEETISLMAEKAHSKGLELVCLFADNVPYIANGDPTRLRQVVTNLVSNAIKFTEQGYVMVRVKRDTTIEDHLALNFAVIDTGIGIPEDAQETVFELFSQADGSTTRKFGGTGLGLALCKKLTQAMGGDIALESEPGEGSAFSFNIQINKSLEQPKVAEIPLVAKGKNIVVLSNFRHDAQRLRQLNASFAKDTILENDIVQWISHAKNADSILLAEHSLLNEAQLNELDKQLADHNKHCVLLIHQNTEITLPSERWVKLKKPLCEKAYLVALGKTDPSSQKATTIKKTIETSFSEDLKVLLVEDNPVNQKVAKGILKKLGIAADVANNGQEALDQFGVNHFDIILMDCQMPVMDGFEATQAIREHEAANSLRKITIIALTANAMEGDKERCIAAGMDDYLAKPFKPADLKATLQRWVH